MTIHNIGDLATDDGSHRQRQRTNLQAVTVGLVANVVLAALKTTFGIIGHSPALLADGINSTSDVAYGIVVAIFMRLSSRPADREHPFGHAQFESIAALMVGAFVLATAVGIFWDAVNGAFDQLTGQAAAIQPSQAALWVALSTVALKIGLFRYSQQIGERLNSSAVTALAYDHRNDIFSASAAVIGISLGRAGFTWVDPLAGAVVALVILRTGIHIVRESAAELMDDVPGPLLAAQVAEAVAGIPGLLSVEDVRAHRFGPYLTMVLTIEVDGSISVAQGDLIAGVVEQRLRRVIESLRAVNIHYHPSSARARAETKPPGN